VSATTRTKAVSRTTSSAPTVAARREVDASDLGIGSSVVTFDGIAVSFYAPRR